MANTLLDHVWAYQSDQDRFAHCTVQDIWTMVDALESELTNTRGRVSMRDVLILRYRIDGSVQMTYTAIGQQVGVLKQQVQGLDRKAARMIRQAFRQSLATKGE